MLKHELSLLTAGCNMVFNPPHKQTLKRNLNKQIHEHFKNKRKAMKIATKDTINLVNGEMR